jgi:hypothetical protein
MSQKGIEEVAFFLIREKAKIKTQRRAIIGFLFSDGMNWICNIMLSFYRFTKATGPNTIFISSTEDKVSFEYDDRIGIWTFKLGHIITHHRSFASAWRAMKRARAKIDNQTR